MLENRLCTDAFLTGLAKLLIMLVPGPARPSVNPNWGLCPSIIHLPYTMVDVFHNLKKFEKFEIDMDHSLVFSCSKFTSIVKFTHASILAENCS